MKQSIQSQLVTASTTLSCVALVLLALSLIWFYTNIAEKHITENISTLGDIVGDNSRGILLFGNRTDANRLLATLEKKQGVDVAILFSSDGQQMGAYTRSFSRTTHIAPPTIEEHAVGYTRFHNDAIVSLHPVYQKNVYLGAVYLQVNHHEWDAVSQNIWLTSMLLCAGVALLSFFLARYLQQRISSPVVHLASVAKSISRDHDFSLRVEPTGPREIAELYDAFNFMVEQIQESHRTRDRNDAQLHAAAEAYRLVLDNAPALITQINLDEQCVIVNTAYANFFGVQRDDLIGKHISEVLGEQGYQKLRPHLQKVLTDGIRVKFVELLELHDRDARWMEGVYVPTFSPSHEVVGAYTFIQDITDQKAAEASSQVLIDQTRALTRRVLEVEERERFQLAQDLHDDVGQTLTVLMMNLQTMNAWKDLPPPLKDRTGDSIATLTELMGHVRETFQTIHPSLLDDLGLPHTIRWHATRQAERAGWQLALHLHTHTPSLSNAAALAGYRVVQESLTNIMRHACATHVTIEVWEEPQTSVLCLMIQDNGVGFDPKAVTRSSHGIGQLGILGMTERLRLVGGDMKILSSAGEGTTLTFSLPTGTEHTTHLAHQTHTQEDSIEQV